VLASGYFRVIFSAQAGSNSTYVWLSYLITHRAGPSISFLVDYSLPKAITSAARLARMIGTAATH